MAVNGQVYIRNLRLDHDSLLDPGKAKFSRRILEILKTIYRYITIHTNTIHRFDTEISIPGTNMMWSLR